MAQSSSSFVLTPEEAKAAGVTDPMKLPLLINRAMSKARSPISEFNVGAVGLGSSGSVFLGVNIEFPGLPIHHSIHAEQFVITNLALNSELKLTHLAVSADASVFDAPCGHCRQFLQEISEAPEIKFLIKDPKKGEDGFVSLDNLVPRRFGPYNLLPEGFPLLLQPRSNGLTLSELDSTGGICGEGLAAANKSFAPYSKCPSGVALRDCDGEVYRGWYMESVAFNPSLGPVQAALVDFVARSGGKGFDKIVEAVVVEKKDAKASQEKTAKMIIETIAASNPKCVFKVFHCLEPLKPM